jgi:hypothetical protein
MQRLNSDIEEKITDKKDISPKINTNRSGRNDLDTESKNIEKTLKTI